MLNAQITEHEPTLGTKTELSFRTIGVFPELVKFSWLSNCKDTTRFAAATANNNVLRERCLRLALAMAQTGSPSDTSEPSLNPTKHQCSGDRMLVHASHNPAHHRVLPHCLVPKAYMARCYSCKVNLISGTGFFLDQRAPVKTTLTLT